MTARAFRLEPLLLDVRDAWRAMRRRPGFAALAVATLALGIGVNTGACAVAYGVIIRPLPYPEPSRTPRTRSAPWWRSVMKGA